MHFPPLFIVIYSGTAHIIGTILWDLVHLGINRGYDAQRKVLYPTVFDMWVQKAGAGMMWIKESKSQNSPKWHQKSVIGWFGSFFPYFSTTWLCRRLRDVWFLPTKLWDKVTATTDALLMSVDTTVPEIPLGKLAAPNFLLQTPGSFHHETGAAKTSHSII